MTNPSEKNDRSIYILYLIWAVSIPWSVFLMQLMPAIIILYTIIQRLLQRQPIVRLDSFLIFILLYILYRFISAMFSPDITKSVISVLDNEWILAGMFFMALNKISLQNRQKILIALIVASVAAGVMGIFQSLTGIYPLGTKVYALGNYYRATGGYSFYLTFAGNQMMVLFITLAFLFWTEKAEVLKKILYVTALGILLAAILLSFARSTWLALLLFLLIIGSVFKRRLFLRLTAPLIILMTLVIAFNADLQDRFVSIFDASRNEPRINLLKTSWNMIQDKPLLGIGPGRFKDVVDEYKVSGYYDTDVHSHNDFVYIAVISGIPALLLWLLIWISWLYHTRLVLKKKSAEAFNQHLLVYISFAIGSILFAGLFQCYYTDLENAIQWVFFMIHGYHIMRDERVLHIF